MLAFFRAAQQDDDVCDDNYERLQFNNPAYDSSDNTNNSAQHM